jgi:hypothetical protein
MSRKIFNYDKLDETKVVSSLKAKTQLYPHTISACGCLFYKKHNSELLLIHIQIQIGQIMMILVVLLITMMIPFMKLFGGK